MYQQLKTSHTGCFYISLNHYIIVQSYKHKRDIFKLNPVCREFVIISRVNLTLKNRQ